MKISCFNRHYDVRMVDCRPGVSVFADVSAGRELPGRPVLSDGRLTNDAQLQRQSCRTLRSPRSVCAGRGQPAGRF